MMLVNTSRGDVVRRVSTAFHCTRLSDPTSPINLNRLYTSLLCLGPLSRRHHQVRSQSWILDKDFEHRPASSRCKPIPEDSAARMPKATSYARGAGVICTLCCRLLTDIRQGHPLPDPMVKLYDVRTLRALPPISFAAGPAFACLHPRDSSKVIVASAQGVLQVIDMSQGASTEFQQVSAVVTNIDDSSMFLPSLPA